MNWQVGDHAVLRRSGKRVIVEKIVGRIVHVMWHEHPDYDYSQTLVTRRLQVDAASLTGVWA